MASTVRWRHRSCFGYVYCGLVWGFCYTVRRSRARRLFRVRRSSSPSPPQTPVSCPVSRAHFRQVSMTAHSWHTDFASSTWSKAAPVFPTGKNSSGSLLRHAERLRQSIFTMSSFMFRESKLCM